MQSVDEVVETVEKEIGYTFNNKELLLEALTHSSYSHEMKINKRNHYERLEFLGDAVLELITTEYLFDNFPDMPEGKLSKRRASMVCEPSLAICARSMKLGNALFLGKGEEASGGRERASVLADIIEAILGAIYLDGGMENARAYAVTHIFAELDEDELFVDNKTKLQEYIQHYFNTKELTYNVIKEDGPEHAKMFTVSVSLGDEVLATGLGKSKKLAQQQAAFLAIKKIRRDNKKK